jgi:hypothetical protein
MSKPKEYHSAYNGVHVDSDGDMLCAKFDDFVNLQESDCGFGRTDAEAIVELAGETRKRLEARVAELERQLDHLKPLELPTEPTRWGVERSPVLEAAMRGNNGPVLMSPPTDGTLARVAELEAERAALKLAKEGK